jgi:hypothetical protein
MEWRRGQPVTPPPCPRVPHSAEACLSDWLKERYDGEPWYARYLDRLRAEDGYGAVLCVGVGWGGARRKVLSPRS